MHIPDGFIDLDIAAVFYVLSIVVLGYSLYRVKKEEVNLSLLGIVAAAIFAAQMLNWPIPGGTSAHLVAGALAGILLGPYAGSLAMATVLIIQCLVFADGGITALGANIWNMAIVDVFIGYYIYKVLENKNRYLAAFLAGWFGITIAAMFAGLEVGLSSSFKYGITTTIPVMGLWHGLLGIIEGIITAAVVGYIYTTRPDIMKKAAEVKVGKFTWAIIGLLILLSPIFAYAAEAVGYSEPLENVAKMFGAEEHPIYEGILPDYTVPGMNPYIGTLISAIVGVAIVLLLGIGISRVSK